MLDVANSAAAAELPGRKCTYNLALFEQTDDFYVAPSLKVRAPPFISSNSIH